MEFNGFFQESAEINDLIYGTLYNEVDGTNNLAIDGSVTEKNFTYYAPAGYIVRVHTFWLVLCSHTGNQNFDRFNNITGITTDDAIALSAKDDNQVIFDFLNGRDYSIPGIGGWNNVFALSCLKKNRIAFDTGGIKTFVWPFYQCKQSLSLNSLGQVNPRLECKIKADLSGMGDMFAYFIGEKCEA
jgi:hypothetical protein